MIRICTLKAENFRAYKTEIKIDFDQNSLILLIGENGYGKTSIIDAIEWCITGDIKRLHRAFEDRTPSAEEKKKEVNRKTILKHKNCKKTDKVKVVLTLDCDGEKVDIFRERQEDTLSCIEEFSVVETKLSENTLQQIELLRLQKNDFYEDNILDMNKGYRFMNMPRTNLRGQIKRFMEDSSEGLKLVEQLKQAMIKIENELGIINGRKKILEERITDTKNQLEKIEILKDIQGYPNKKVYRTERIDITSIQQAEIQLGAIRGWGIKQIEIWSENLASDKEIQKEQEEIRKLSALYEQKTEKILDYINNQWYLPEKTEEIYTTIEKCERILKSLDIPFSADEEELSDLQEVQARYNEGRKTYKRLQTEIDMLAQTVSTFGKGTKLIELFQSIIESKDEIQEGYLETGHKKCPVCGSVGILDNMETQEIGKAAESFLKEQESSQNKVIEQKSTKIREAADLWEVVKDTVLVGFTDQKKKYVDILDEVRKVQEEIQPFLDKADQLKFQISEDILEQINCKYKKNEKEIMSEEINSEIRKKLEKSILYLIPQMKDDLDKGDYRKICIQSELLYDQTMEYQSFDYEIMIQKLTFLEAYLNSEEKAKCLQKLDKLQKTLDKENNIIDQYNKKLNRLKQLADNISKSIIDLENSEIREIGPLIANVFCKIIKHSSIKELNFVTDRSGKIEKTGVSLQDENSNNVMNMLSDGQMNVFMVAYFIGNLSVRSADKVISSYFIDDVTSFLDDINMLSFLDILKYMLSSSEPLIQQLFFSTCNKNIEELMINRMEGFGINYSKIEFLSVGKPQIAKR